MLPTSRMMLRESVPVEETGLVDGILSSVISTDPYMHSLGFVMMTGRKGLVVKRVGQQIALHSPHPNTDGEELLFPVNPLQNMDAIADVVQSFPLSRIMRLESSVAEKLATYLKDKLVNFSVAVQAEDVLDYVFPVHTVDCRAFLELKGQHLYNFKKTLHKSAEHGLSHRAIDFANDQQAIAEIIKLWSHQLPHFTPDMTTGAAKYYAGILSRMIAAKGLIVFQGTRPVAITFWEDALYGQTCSNALITLADRTIKGISEYLHYYMLKQTYADGHPYMCIGGAETASLDFFKRKMNPIRSLSLVSVMVRKNSAGSKWHRPAANLGSNDVLRHA